MGRLLLTIALLATSMPAVMAASEDPEADFHRGNILYQEGNFTEAIQAYEAIAATGVTSADVFYNLANAYYRSGDTGKALLNYERTLTLRPSDPEARLNADFLRSSIAAMPATRSWQDRWFGSASLNTFAIVASVAGWTLVGTLVLIFFLRLTPLRGLAAVVSGLVLTYCAAALALRGEESSNALALITSADVKAYYSPSSTAESVGPLPLGTPITLLSESGAWTYCQLPDQRRGWISSTAAERIVPQ